MNVRRLDFVLTAASPYAGGAGDGTELGVDTVALTGAIAGVAQSRQPA
jgi:hypothetical protein